MTPLYRFSDKSGQPKDYKCDCTLCGGDPDDWTAMSNTQKMVRALILTTQYMAHQEANRIPFQS